MSYLVVGFNDFLTAATDDYFVTAELAEAFLVLTADAFLVTNTDNFLVKNDGVVVVDGTVNIGPVPTVGVRVGTIPVTKARAGPLVLWE